MVEDRSKDFCVLMVHGTFASDFAGRQSEFQRREKIKQSAAQFRNEQLAAYAPGEWHSDDDAYWIDSGAEHVSGNQGEVDDRRIEQIGNRWFKRVTTWVTQDEWALIAARRHEIVEGVDQYFVEIDQSLMKSQDHIRNDSGYDAFLGVPCIDRISCLARALSFLSLSGEGQIYVRSIRWPDKENVSILPLNSHGQYSAANSEVARSRATKQLIGEMKNLERANVQYVVVGHSHGGSIAIDAVRSMQNSAKSFRGLITFGAPYIRRRPRRLFEAISFIAPNDLTLLLVIALYGVGASASLIGGGASFSEWKLWSFPTLTIATLGVAVIAAIAALINDFSARQTNKNFEEFRKQKKYILHYLHPGDEIVGSFSRLFEPNYRPGQNDADSFTRCDGTREAVEGGERPSTEEESQTNEMRNPSVTGSVRVAKKGSKLISRNVIGLRLVNIALSFLFFLGASFALSGAQAWLAPTAWHIEFANFPIAEKVERLFCPASELGCNVTSRFKAAFNLSIWFSGFVSIWAVAQFVIAMVRSHFAIQSWFEKLFAIGLLGLRRNAANVDGVGDGGAYNPLPCDVINAIDAVKFSQRAEFGRLVTGLPIQLADASSGDYRQLLGISKSIMGSPAITHNAYVKSETFLLFLAKKIADLAGEHVKAWDPIFDFADYMAYRRDMAAVINVQETSVGVEREVDRNSDSNSDHKRRPKIPPFPFTRGRWSRWLKMPSDSDEERASMPSR